jgi:hypothetical protein
MCTPVVCSLPLRNALIFSIIRAGIVPLNGRPGTTLLMVLRLTTARKRLGGPFKPRVALSWVCFLYRKGWILFRQS